MFRILSHPQNLYIVPFILFYGLMMMDKVLFEIRHIEAKADQLLQDAREKAAQFIVQGKSDAAFFVAEQKKELLEEKATALQQRKKELERELQKYLKKAEKQAEDLAAQAAKQKKKALSFLLKEFAASVAKEQ